MKKLILVLLIVIASAFAQTATSDVPEVYNSNPKSDYFAFFGASIGASGKPSGLTGFGVKLDEKTYLTTSTDIDLSMVRNGQLFNLNSFRPGVERIMWEHGPLIVTARGEAGIATAVNGTLGGAFSGGGSVAVDLSHFVKKRVFFFGSGRVVDTSLGDRSAVYSFGLLFPISKR